MLMNWIVLIKSMCVFQWIVSNLSVDVLLTFLCDRIKDHHSVTPHVLRGMQALVSLITSWSGDAFFITGPLWGEPPLSSGFPSQRASNVLSFDAFSLLTWTSCWTNSPFADTVRHRDAHVMSIFSILTHVDWMFVAVEHNEWKCLNVYLQSLPAEKKNLMHWFNTRLW